MTTMSTPVSLIAYLYRELPPENTRALQQELAINALLSEEFDSMVIAKKALPQVTFSPTDKTLADILAYSLGCPVQA